MGKPRHNLERLLQAAYDYQCMQFANASSKPGYEMPEIKSVWRGLLDFLEHGATLSALFGIGALVGALVFSPFFILCAISLLFAFHRTVLKDRPWKVQARTQIILAIAMTVGGYYLHSYLDAAVNRFQADFAKRVAALVSSQQKPEEKPRPTGIATMTDSEIIRVRTDAVGRINESYEWLRNYRAEIQNKSSLPPMVREPIIENLHDDLGKWYRQTHLPEAKRIRQELIGQIRNMPPTAAEGLYADLQLGEPVPTVDIDMQLGDLRRLLNELERENNLPLSCQELNILY